MIGVLHSDQNVSKGLITTTAGFAPGIVSDPDIKRFMPYRLELRAKDQLLEWLAMASRTATQQDTPTP